ncbi:serine/threonine protein kinase, partial [Oxalobacteraceae bacterium OM1]
MNPAAAASIAADNPPHVRNGRIGRFCITRELGRGTLGCVYLAHDPVIGRDVAIKTFSPRLSVLDRQKHEEHFVNEARAAGRLAHPHIVTVYDVFSDGGASF